MNIKLLSIMLIGLSTNTFGQIPHPEEYVFCNVLAAPNSYISVVCSTKDENMRFVTKQKIGHARDKDRLQLLGIFDKLGASIVESVGTIPGNKVKIIPENVEFPGKHFQQRAATLHSFITGVPTGRGGRFVDVRLNQLYFSVPKKKRGINRNVIKNMALHPDLPILCAIDTFVGNSDRCCNNLVYDPNIDRFFAFDFSEAFSKRLCRVATIQVNKLNEDGGYKAFTPAEQEGLISYRNTMAALVARNYPRRMFSRLDRYIKEMFGERTPDWSARIFLSKRKHLILESYYDALELIAALNKLISSFNQEE